MDLTPSRVTIHYESGRLVLSCGTFIMLHKMVLTFEPVDKILKCDPSNENY